MKIAFVGDSYCANTDKENDWPAIVATKSNAEIIQTGFGGQAFYPPFELFLSENFYQADYIIVCPTGPYRLINKYNLPFTQSWVETISKQVTDKKGHHWDRIKDGCYEQEYNISTKVLINEIIPGAKAYYDHFMTDQCTETMNIGIISLLDNLLKEHNKKVIWLPSFNVQYPIFYHKFNKQHYYIPESGPSSNISLFDISKAELIHQKLSEQDINYVLANDSRRNHFNTANNGILAKIVLDIIEKDDFSPKAIKMEEYFSHLDLNNMERTR